jgi:uncharacterized delta-60 repeat protein
MLSTFRTLWRTLSSKAPTQPAPRGRLSFRPHLEALEDRCLLNAGFLDPTFGTGVGLVNTPAPGGAQSVLIQPDGKTLAFGSGYVARYNTNGSLDASFGSGGIAQVNFTAAAEALQPDGKILMTEPGAAVMRLNSNGSLDTSFGNQGEVTTTFNSTLDLQSIAGIVVQPDGRIVLAAGNGGELKNYTSLAAFDLARFNTNGSLDTSFGNAGVVVTSMPKLYQVVAKSLLLQPNGNLIVAADTGSSIAQDWLLARYTPNGTLDSSFGMNGIVTSPSIAFQGGPNGCTVAAAVLYPNAGTPYDGDIAVVGTGLDSLVGAQWEVVRYTSNGSLDTTFGNGGDVITSIAGEPAGVALDASDRLIVVGSPPASSTSDMTLARFNTDGTLDGSFGSGGVATAGIPGTQSFGVAIYPSTDSADSGKIAVAGGTTVARFLPSAPAIGPSFVVVGPPSITAGTPFTFTVTATDGSGNTLTTYTGTVQFSSLLSGVILPADYTFTAADQGVHTFTATFKTTGLQALFVADTQTPEIDGLLVSIQVNPGAAASFVLSAFPSSVKSGGSLLLYATAVDAYGNATSFTGTVGFSSSDSKATLPGNETFPGNNAALGRITLRTKGTQTITIFDVADHSIMGTTTITVT